MAPPDLPLWAWNLIIAIQRHEELHGKEDTCLDGVLNAVPAEVRQQAEAINSYVHKANSTELGKRIEKNLVDLVGSFAGIKRVLAEAEPKPDAHGEAP
ncbi:hypothetical protein ABZ819_05350 [Streptomyces venezuelae]|uniref:hypothetical protein n=1 Tax=Streptomyces venezuelae TaxID=54571 RepID=UPI00341E1D30